jgi:Zn-dependent M28 family amino/carboxypeptidase
VKASLDLAVLEARLRQHVGTLARTPRTPGTPEHRQAGDYIRQHLQQAGFRVHDETVQLGAIAGLNLLSDPVPDRSELPLFIVGAHYDTIPHSPGADDNASAVAALLELAQALGASLGTAGSWSTRLQLAAYDLEEYGLIGSALHSRELKRAGTAIRGMISLEMLGYCDSGPNSQRLPAHLSHLYPHVGNFIGVCGNEASRSLLETVTAGLKGIPGLPVEALAVPGRGEAVPEVRLSDHSSFWDWGFPALMITDTSFFRNPHYHQTSDTPETLDYPFLAKVTAGVVQGVLEMVSQAT